MSALNKILACHHIELQKNCQWCNVYKQQSISQCDRCKNFIYTDLVFLSNKDGNSQLICIYCRHDERAWGS